MVHFVVDKRCSGGQCRCVLPYQTRQWCNQNGVAPGRTRRALDQAGNARSYLAPTSWLVEEVYQRYLADPSSVDRAWWSFFADYTPALANGTGPQPVITASRPAAAAPAAGSTRPARPAAAAAPPPAPPAATCPRRPAAPAAQRPRPRPLPPVAGSAPARARSRGQQAARRRRAHRRQHDGQPGRARRHQRPLGARPSSWSTTGS